MLQTICRGTWEEEEFPDWSKRCGRRSSASMRMIIHQLFAMARRYIALQLCVFARAKNRSFAERRVTAAILLQSLTGN